MQRRSFLGALVALPACWGADSAAAPNPTSPAQPAKSGPPPQILEPGVKGLPTDPEKVEKITKTPEEWRAILSPEAYNVLREQGTERAFTGLYWNLHDPGTFLCSGCGLTLFNAADKFDSGTGWPSFTRPVKADRIADTSDKSLGMERTEVACARCGGHQGHVFDDGPAPTGLRYCIDSVSLVFRPAKT